MGSDAAAFIVGAKSVAVTSALVALGSLATLAIVVGVKDVDILSTVALALAILAFVVQLIVYVVQSASATQQLTDARTLHGEMMSVLAELQTRSAGTQRSIDSLHEQMITDLRRKAAGPDAVPVGAQVVIGAASEPAESRASSTTAAASSSTEGEWSSRVAYPEPPSAEVAQAIQQELASWPTVQEMKDEILPLVESKDDDYLNTLRWVVSDARDFTRRNAGLGPGVEMNDSDVLKLIEEGFAEKIPGWKLATASARGRRFGRIFTAQGPPPPGTPDEIIAVRERLRPEPLDPDRFRDR